MSKFWMRRGLERHKFQFRIGLEYLQVQGRLNGKVCVELHRGSRLVVSSWVEGENDPQTGESGVALWHDEQLVVMATMYYSPKTGVYQSKSGKLVVKVDKGRGPKHFGRFEFDLSRYVDRETPQALEFQLEKCADPEAVLRTEVSAERVRGSVADDLASSVASTSTLGLMSDLDDFDQTQHSGGFRFGNELRVPDRRRQHSRGPVDLTSSSTDPTQDSRGGATNLSSSLPVPQESSQSKLDVRDWQAPPPGTASGTDIRMYYERRVQTLMSKLARGRDEMREMSRRFTAQEVALVDTKVKLVNTMDRLNDVEMENIELRRQLEELRQATSPATGSKGLKRRNNSALRNMFG
ncbi:MAG: hypothetical protein MHM6MM_006917 [Cercozoa sp. M6MM]